MKDKMLSVFKGKQTLFLENDYGLYNADGVLERFLIDNKCQYNVLAKISELPKEYIIDMIEWYDVIAFQTQWVYDISKELAEVMFSHKFRTDKIIVECYIEDPTWNYIPEGLPNNHELYIFHPGNYEPTEYPEDFNESEFHKLKKAKAY